MNKRKQNSSTDIAIVALLLVILSLVGILAYGRIASRNNSIDGSTQGSSDEKDLLKIERLETLGLRIAMYEATWLKGGYVKQTAKDWNAFRDHLIEKDIYCESVRISPIPCREALTDPYTGTLYEFTEDLPEFGEVQYKFPMACDSPNRDGKEFEQGSHQAHAMKVKLSNGYHCRQLTF